METTLNKIKSHVPCEDGWEKLLLSMGKTSADDDSVSIKHIIHSNGIEDAIWALRSVDGHNREIRLFAAWCAEQSLHVYERDYPNDMRPRLAIKAARDYANGIITKERLNAARAAAEAAAWDAARAAAGAATWAAAGDAAGAAARAATWAAARDAARAAQKHELLRVCGCVENGTDPYPNI